MSYCSYQKHSLPGVRIKPATAIWVGLRRDLERGGGRELHDHRVMALLRVARCALDGSIANCGRSRYGDAILKQAVTRNDAGAPPLIRHHRNFAVCSAQMAKE